MSTQLVMNQDEILQQIQRKNAEDCNNLDD